MCRYAFHIYKPHFACLHCRKMFRPVAQEDLAVARPAGWGMPSRLNKTYPQREFKCPLCAQPMHKMGLNFKPPKHNDLKQWRKVALLVRNGFAWHDCGCGGGGPNCKNLRDAEQFVTSRDEYKRRHIIKSKQQQQNEKWRKMRNWPRVHLKDESSTR